jgi:hypothetical protein
LALSALGWKMQPMLKHTPWMMILVATLLTGCASKPTDNSVDAQLQRMGRDPQIEKMLAEVDRRQIENTVRTLVSFKTRHTLSDTTSEREGIGAARRWIKAQFDRYSRESGGRLVVAFEETRIDRTSERVPKPFTLVNVTATLRGSDREARERVFIVSGHYDSRALDVNDYSSPAPGANDDASGTALVMELARVMSKYQFDATIVFACVAGEEQGLLGAAALAERARSENWQVGAMFTDDIVGNTQGGNGVHDDSRVRVFSEGIPTYETPIQLQARHNVGGENDGPARQLARYIRETSRQYVKAFDVSLVFRRDRYGRSGDHIPFLRQGYPAVRFTEPNEHFDRQHQNVGSRGGRSYGDVIDYVDFDYIAKVARVNGAALANLARAPAPPRSVTIDPAPSYDTKLSWEPGQATGIAGYAVLVRETTSPIWQRRIDVGNVKSVMLNGLSKDDLLFAVEAYDSDAHRSTPTPPLPRSAASQRATTGPT